MTTPPEPQQLGRLRSVWKFEVPIGSEPEFATVMMPARSEIVRVGSQGDKVFVWAIVDPAETEPERRRLCSLPTGYNTDLQSAAYVGTTEIHDGQIVVHVFEDVAARMREKE